MRRAYFSFGSNLGDRGRFLREGVAAVVEENSWRASSVYVTEPVGGVVQDDFWNLVLEVTTDASARELLERARRAEELAQRTRDVRWGPRTLDVDVLLVGSDVVNEPDLIVPHPRMHERAFVLVPLRELRPDLVDDAALARADGAVAIMGTLESLQ